MTKKEILKIADELLETLEFTAFKAGYEVGYEIGKDSADNAMNYCPQCGAKLKGADDEENVK